jgi:hypothetical protein
MATPTVRLRCGCTAKANFYILYVTTDPVTGEYYAGRHNATRRNCTYLGSGEWPLNHPARWRLQRHTLAEFATEDELIAAEQEWIDANLGLPLCMNKAPHSAGGWQLGRAALTAMTPEEFALVNAARQAGAKRFHSKRHKAKEAAKQEGLAFVDNMGRRKGMHSDPERQASAERLVALRTQLAADPDRFAASEDARIAAIGEYWDRLRPLRVLAVTAGEPKPGRSDEGWQGYLAERDRRKREAEAAGLPFVDAHGHRIWTDEQRAACGAKARENNERMSADAKALKNAKIGRKAKQRWEAMSPEEQRVTQGRRLAQRKLADWREPLRALVEQQQPITTTAVAKHFGITNHEADRRLELLRDAGQLQSEKRQFYNPARRLNVWTVGEASAEFLAGRTRGALLRSLTKRAPR